MVMIFCFEEIPDVYFIVFSLLCIYIVAQARERRGS